MFLCCYVKHINLVKIHPERVTQEDKKLVNSLNYAGIEFQHSTFNIQHSLSLSILIFQLTDHYKEVLT